MEFLNLVIKYASMAVTGFGGVIAVMGLVNFGEGKSQNNAGKQDEGMSKIVGGGIVIVVGLFLVPQLASFFSL